LRVLGIITSYRRLGNTEILVKEALLEAQKLGAEVHAIRLPKLTVKVCKACYHCFYEECKLGDDVDWVFEEIAKSDAVVLGTPTYILSVPGILKMVMDRVLSLFPKAERFRRKPAALIVTAGLRGWEGFAVPMASLFLLIQGFRIIDRLVAYATGPGEILMDEEVIGRAREMGAKIIRALKGEKILPKTEENECPICGSRALEIRGDVARCPICDLTGKIEISNGRIRIKFPEDPYEHSKWTEEEWREHFEWLKWTVQEYFRKRSQIEQLRAKYASFDPFISPTKSRE